MHQLMNEQYKEESGCDKNRSDKESKNYDIKSNVKEKNLKRKKEIRNYNLSVTNGTHNSASLTREHQMRSGGPNGKCWTINDATYLLWYYP